MLQSVKNKQTVSILSKLKMPDDTKQNGPSIAPVDIFSGVESRPEDEDEETPSKPKTILRKKKPEEDEEEEANSGRNLLLGGPK